MCVCVCVRLTDEGVLVELLQVGGGARRPVDDLPLVDLGLREELHGGVRPVRVFDGA